MVVAVSLSTLLQLKASVQRLSCCNTVDQANIIQAAGTQFEFSSSPHELRLLANTPVLM
jgi:hypothetical protein